MRWILAITLLMAGCAQTTKTTVSVYFEKDLYISGSPDGKARVEYKIEQNEPWPFQKRLKHE